MYEVYDRREPKFNASGVFSTALVPSIEMLSNK